MFCDIKDQLDNPAVLRILALSVYEESLEGMAQKAQIWREDETAHCHGWVKNGILFGVCAFVVHADKVEITNIAVDKTLQRGGIGRAMINALQSHHALPIEAETDDDAVGFYRKCGFEATETRKKHGRRRWTCVLREHHELFI